jgi:hypothetical protein
MMWVDEKKKGKLWGRMKMKQTKAKMMTPIMKCP